MKTTFISMMFFLVLLANVGTAVAQNIGVGTLYRVNGNLVIKNSGLVSGLVVGDSAAGVSFGEINTPFIGFNTYYRNGRKLMDNGYGGYWNFSHITGTLYFAGASASGMSKEIERRTVKTHLIG